MQAITAATTVRQRTSAIAAETATAMTIVTAAATVMMKTAATTAVQQKMSLNSDIQTIENIIGFAVIVLFVIIYNIAIIGFLFLVSEVL